MILWEELGPVHRAVRRLLYNAGILSSLNIVVNEWSNQWEDQHGQFGIMLGVEVVRPTGQSTVPSDVMLTIACEPQGSRDEQERRAFGLLRSICGALVDSGNFEFVLAAGDRLYSREEIEPPQFRRYHLGFNVTDVELLREERQS